MKTRQDRKQVLTQFDLKIKESIELSILETISAINEIFDTHTDSDDKDELVARQVGMLPNRLEWNLVSVFTPGIRGNSDLSRRGGNK